MNHFQSSSLQNSSCIYLFVLHVSLARKKKNIATKNATWQQTLRSCMLDPSTSTLTPNVRMMKLLLPLTSVSLCNPNNTVKHVRP